MGDFVRFIEFLYNFLHFYRVSNPLKLNLSLNFASFLQTHWESIKYAELYPLSRFIFLSAIFKSTSFRRKM